MEFVCSRPSILSLFNNEKAAASNQATTELFPEGRLENSPGENIPGWSEAESEENIPSRLRAP
jgi:hypothetical protein